MQRMSFALTTDQVRARRMRVTRRLGWLGLRVGDRLLAVEKVMGFRKGERAPEAIATIEVVDVRREPLDAITDEDVEAEGFPDETPEWFIERFCRSHKGCTPATTVTRIEFRYVAPAANRAADARLAFVHALLDMEPPDQRAAILQLFHDVVDAVEQGPLDEAVGLAAHAFEVAVQLPDKLCPLCDGVGGKVVFGGDWCAACSRLSIDEVRVLVALKTRPCMWCYAAADPEPGRACCDERAAAARRAAEYMR